MKILSLGDKWRIDLSTIEWQNANSSRRESNKGAKTKDLPIDQDNDIVFEKIKE